MDEAISAQTLLFDRTSPPGIKGWLWQCTSVYWKGSAASTVLVLATVRDPLRDTGDFFVLQCTLTFVAVTSSNKFYKQPKIARRMQPGPRKRSWITCAAGVGMQDS